MFEKFFNDVLLTVHESLVGSVAEVITGFFGGLLGGFLGGS